VVKSGLETRLADSFETACKLADGIAIVEYADKDNTKEPIIFSQKFACPVSGFTIAEIEPRLFSFNNPNGACQTCDGLGVQLKFDPDLIVPETDKTIQNGAVAPWSKGNSPLYFQTLQAICEHFGDKLTTPWKELKPETRKTIIYGSGKEKIQFIYEDGNRRYETTKVFEGVLPNLERRWRDTDSNWIRDDLEKYQSAQTCPSCGGKRLRPEALAVKINKLDISEASTFSIRNAHQWFEDLNDILTDRQKEIGARILKEIRERLRFLVNVGLDYLTLHRGSATLSGGESQRIRLASQIGSGLTGVLYVLDEPSIGLHQRDNTLLLESLKGLRDLGNSVLVVEHDEEAILTADHVIDMGLRAGIHGGEVIAQGTPKDIENHPTSITGAYLRGELEVPIPQKRRKPNKSKMLVLKGATGNNLKNVTLNLPLGLLTCITGVSGGGKSTLIIETLYKILARRLNGASEHPAPYDDIEGYHLLDKVIDIDQSPIGRTPRSNPATYTGTFDPIRQWFANLPEAKARGYGPGRFSFNVKGGRCEVCQGDGVQKIEMHFLPDVYVTCDTCNGNRYNRETLDVRYRNKSISDVLEMTVDEGADFFGAVPAIRDKLLTLSRVGLGYIKIGQPATTLSGGEAQRVKLAKELAKRSTGRTFYILDEPTTGLHFEDTRKLMEVLQELAEGGNTIVIIEHNLDVIKTADWIIDLGPEGGDGGGQIIAEGTPEDVAKTDTYTGKYLKHTLEIHETRRKNRNKK
jgi:excinuclease ABC subunit A